MGCINNITLLKSEVYVLRTLPLPSTGVESCADLRNVGNVVRAPYPEERQKFGLLTDDAECKRVLHDGFESSFQPFTKLFTLTTSNFRLSDLKVQLFITRICSSSISKIDLEII